MTKNPIIPYILIMLFGIGLIFFLSVEGIGNQAEIAESGEHGEHGEEGAEGGEGASAGEFDPEAVAQQKCIGCHGSSYEGQGNTPSLVGTELSEEEIADIIANGKGAMPGGLVEAGNIEEMAAWVKSLE